MDIKDQLKNLFPEHVPKEHERKDKRMKVLEKQIEGLLNSNSFKLGWAVLAPVRFLKNLMQK